jgi:hypothetical protein
MRSTAAVLITSLYLVGAGSARLCAADPATTGASKDAILKTLAADPDVVWSDFEKTQPMFVPEHLLNGAVPMEQLPISPLVLRDLHELLHSVARSGDPRSCRQMTHMLGIGPPKVGSTHPIEDYLAGKTMQVIGHVTKIEKGLFFWPQNVASLVHVQVEEVVRDDSKRVKTGQNVRFFILGGSLSIGGLVMGIDDGNPPFQAEVNQRLYIAGLDSQVNPDLIDGGVPFVLSGDHVMDAGYDQITMTKPITLDEARERAHKVAPHVH